MNKRVIRHMVWTSLLALAGFFVFLASFDHVLYVQQGDNLRAVYRTYHDLGGQTTLIKDARVTITRLNGKATTQRQKVIQDVINRERTVVDTKTTTVTINGHQEQLFIGQSEDGFVGIAQPKATMWGSDPARTLLVVCLYWAFVFWLLWRSVQKDRYWAGHIAAMTHNIARIRREHTVSPMILTSGSPFLAMGNEINRLEQTVDHLRQKIAVRQESFDRLIDHLPQGVMLIDADRHVLLSNQAMAAFVGHPIASEQHNYLDDIKTYALARMIEHTFRNQKNHHKELTLMATHQAVDASVIALKATTQREQVLVILYDVTYLRQIEQMQLDFVGNVSHELKTPITAISGFAETLLNGAKDDPAVRDRFLGIIRDESLRLTQLITDILTLSQPEVQAPQHTAVNIRALIDAAFANVQAAIAEKALTVQVDVSSKLIISSDQVKLAQVIRNLIDNAVFYNRQDGSVTVAAAIQGDLLTLQVQDTGIGIADANQHRIFERFYRVDKARSRHSGGTGLGMAIVAESLAQLGGDVTLESQIGVGSTFTVTVPVR